MGDRRERGRKRPRESFKVKMLGRKRDLCSMFYVDIHRAKLHYRLERAPGINAV